MTVQTEIISRAVYIENGYILCVHRIGQDNIFLPGGHVEAGESAEQGCLRELDEEIGEGFSVSSFMSTVEHAYDCGDNRIYEINLLFRITHPDIISGDPVSSKENHLEFMWVPCREDSLEKENLQPWVLQDSLPQYDQTGSIEPFLTTLK